MICVVKEYKILGSLLFYIMCQKNTEGNYFCTIYQNSVSSHILRVWGHYEETCRGYHTSFTLLAPHRIHLMFNCLISLSFPPKKKSIMQVPNTYWSRPGFNSYLKVIITLVQISSNLKIPYLYPPFASKESAGCILIGSKIERRERFNF